MDSNGPRGTQGVLLELAQLLLLNLPRLRIDRIADVGPQLVFHLDGLLLVVTADEDFPFIVDVGYLAEFAVEITVVGVIGDEHHARAPFEPQLGRIGIVALRKVALDFRVEGGLRPWQARHFALIDPVGLVVMRGQENIVGILGDVEIGLILPLQGGHIGGCQLVVADMIENLDEVGIILAGDMVELHAGQRVIADDLAVEEIGRGVIRGQHRPLLGHRHRSHLVKIADEDDLHAAEGLVLAEADVSQHRVDFVHHIGAHHTHLIDDEELKLLYYLALPPGNMGFLYEVEPPFRRGHERGERQLEERVDGHPVGVDGCHACGRNHRHLLLRVCP